MSLSYYFTFGAPPEVRADELIAFLKRVEAEAKSLGFSPTLVLNAAFDSTERQAFARRLTKGMRIEDKRLIGVELPKGTPAWLHDSREGLCRVMPTNGVMLVLTDDQANEIVLGFFQYPEIVQDISGRKVAESGLRGDWYFSGFVDSPDPRYRRLIRMFAESHYLISEIDEFASVRAT